MWYTQFGWHFLVLLILISWVSLDLSGYARFPNKQTWIILKYCWNFNILTNLSWKHRQSIILVQREVSYTLHCTRFTPGWLINSQAKCSSEDWALHKQGSKRKIFLLLVLGKKAAILFILKRSPGKSNGQTSSLNTWLINKIPGARMPVCLNFFLRTKRCLQEMVHLEI